MKRKSCVPANPMFGLIVIALNSLGCGSGTTTPPLVISVTVSPGAITIQGGATAQFSAVVTNDSTNKGVTWSVTCSQAPCGTVSPASTPSGIATTYTAPANSPTAGLTVAIVATSLADSSKTASATITIPSTTLSVSVAPPTATVQAGATAPFTATVTNDPANKGVTWAVSCPTAPCGSVSPTSTASGAATTYTAPAEDSTVVLTATSVTDPTCSSTATLTISTTAKSISVSISPTSASVRVGDTQPFSAVVNNDASGAGVTWSLSSCSGIEGSCGVLAILDQTDTLYAAPSAPAAAQSNAILTATSVTDTTKSASALVTISPALVNFATQNYPIGNSPVAVITADFNHDGKMDVALADEGSPSGGDNGGISILLGNGDGTFQTASHVDAGNNPASIAVGDFNSDGKLDLVVADLGDRPNGTLSILLGNGDGTFQPPSPISVGQKPLSIAVGDFNNDGKLDLAVSDYGDPSTSNNGAVYILIGRGDGTFQPAEAISAGENPVSLVVKDFNGDGILDLAVADQNDPSSMDHGGVSVLLGKGDGTFQTPSFFDIAFFPTSIATGDLNGDGKPDLVVSSYTSVFGLSKGVLNVLLGDGSGKFVASAFTTGETEGGEGTVFPLSVVLGDFDGDGKQDLAEIIGQSVSVFLGKGDGTFHGQLITTGHGEQSFQGRLIFGAGTDPFALAIGELNGDSKTDLAVANMGSNDVSILVNTSGP